jgi:hypothetical protein
MTHRHTSRTAHLLALTKKDDEVRPGLPGSVTRKAPGAVVALLG